jgi:Bax protein
MSIAQKKKRFYSLLVGPINRVHKELMAEYRSVKADIENGNNLQKIQELKVKYKAKSDLLLLYALKPHPQSITLAQALMESAWGTSRFFVSANNVFGMWSVNKNEKRIPAKYKRNGVKTVWLRKFDTIDDSIRAYYFLMAKGKAYKKFRKVRYETDDVYKMVKKLDKYSELGDIYTQSLSSAIRRNKLTRFDK